MTLPSAARWFVRSAMAVAMGVYIGVMGVVLTRAAYVILIGDVQQQESGR